MVIFRGLTTRLQLAFGRNGAEHLVRSTCRSTQILSRQGILASKP